LFIEAETKLGKSAKGEQVNGNRCNHLTRQRGAANVPSQRYARRVDFWLRPARQKVCTIVKLL